METTTQNTIGVSDSRVYSLVFLFDMHSKFYRNVLEGISDNDAHNRMDTKANHIAWIAGSIVYERFGLAAVLGAASKGKTAASYELFKDHQGIQDTATYPLLSEYKRDWEIISPHLRRVISELTTLQLDGADPYEMPGEESTLFDTLSFMIDRESYCIGQIGLYRRLLGYPAMKYQ